MTSTRIVTPAIREASTGQSSDSSRVFAKSTIDVPNTAPTATARPTARDANARAFLSRFARDEPGRADGNHDTDTGDDRRALAGQQSPSDGHHRGDDRGDGFDDAHTAGREPW